MVRCSARATSSTHTSISGGSDIDTTLVVLMGDSSRHTKYDPNQHLIYQEIKSKDAPKDLVCSAEYVS